MFPYNLCEYLGIKLGGGGGGLPSNCLDRNFYIFWATVILKTGFASVLNLPDYTEKKSYCHQLCGLWFSTAISVHLSSSDLPQVSILWQIQP